MPILVSKRTNCLTLGAFSTQAGHQLADRHTPPRFAAFGVLPAGEACRAALSTCFGIGREGETGMPRVEFGLDCAALQAGGF